MSRTLIAIMVTAIAGGALLAGATVAFDAWHWKFYSEAQALQSSASAADAVIVENPYQSSVDLLEYLALFLACCAAMTFWTVFLMIPSLLASRRIFSGVYTAVAVAAAVVAVISGVVFMALQRFTPYIPAAITFAVGGAIGLVGILLLARLLPPNTSLERTREG
jgi:hypothetical protein